MSDKSMKNRFPHIPMADLEFAKEISKETLVKLLVAKGLLSVPELLDEEKKTRTSSLPQQAHHVEQNETAKNKGLRHFASKHRWSRNMTTFLFGWQWKKIKSVSSQSKSSEQQTT